MTDMKIWQKFVFICGILGGFILPCAFSILFDSSFFVTRYASMCHGRGESIVGAAYYGKVIEIAPRGIVCGRTELTEEYSLEFKSEEILFPLFSDNLLLNFFFTLLYPIIKYFLAISFFTFSLRYYRLSHQKHI